MMHLFQDPNFWYAISFAVFCLAGVPAGVRRVNQMIAGYQQKVDLQFVEAESIFQESKGYLEAQKKAAAHIDRVLKEMVEAHENHLEKEIQSIEQVFQERIRLKEKALQQKIAYMENRAAWEQRVRLVTATVSGVESFFASTSAKPAQKHLQDQSLTHAKQALESGVTAAS